MLFHHFHKALVIYHLSGRTRRGFSWKQNEKHSHHTSILSKTRQTLQTPQTFTVMEIWPFPGYCNTKLCFWLVLSSCSFLISFLLNERSLRRESSSFRVPPTWQLLHFVRHFEEAIGRRYFERSGSSWGILPPLSERFDFLETSFNSAPGIQQLNCFLLCPEILWILKLMLVGSQLHL